ncbi:MAG: BrxA/BrxB family bacilliredoxin, partial [Cyclobacteriaceae bacterium]
MYPDELTAPMRQDLVAAGFNELTSASEVEAQVKESGTTLMVVNSVCGCAAGTARPGVKKSLEGAKKPTNLATVFAGVHKEATDKAREFMLPYPPSSPS